MIAYFVMAILIILFGAFLYWAYLPDYKRNPRGFWRTILGMPIGMLLGAIGFTNLNERIKKWARSERNNNK